MKLLDLIPTADILLAFEPEESFRHIPGGVDKTHFENDPQKHVYGG